MNSIPPVFQGYIAKLDTVQTQVFKKLDDIIEASDPQKISETSIDVVRTQISKEATNLILKFEELVTILEIQTKDYRQVEGLPILVSVYRCKAPELKKALRETQLKSYKLEEEFIHNQRVDKFGKVPEREKTMGEMRNELFEGRLKSEEKELQEKNVEDQIMQQNKSITASLQNTRQLMTSSILQTELNIDSIEQQTQDLSTFDSLLSDLGSTLKKSKNIVKIIEKQDRQDKNRIYLSIGFLLICCAWVIWRRILGVPVKIFLWSLLKIFRIFVWFLPKSETEQMILESAVASTGIIAATATGIMATQSSISKDLESLVSEPLVEVKGDGTVSTWEEIIQSTGLVKDEL